MSVRKIYKVLDIDEENQKFLSPDPEEEHVLCPASLHISVNLKKFKCERTCAANAQCAVYTLALAARKTVEK